LVQQAVRTDKRLLLGAVEEGGDGTGVGVHTVTL
jgi:hypothetical protein